MAARRSLKGQQGAATLLLALILMMSGTIVTLSVARTQMVEQRISGNTNWHTRLTLRAESGLAEGLTYLNRSFDGLTWTPTPDGGASIHKTTLQTGDEGTQTQVVFSRPPGSKRYVSVQALSQRNDGSGIGVRVTQHARPLSVLTPRAESAPPLVINGCLIEVANNVHIRPLNADTDQAGDAAWINQAAHCPTPASVDTHRGRIRRKDFGQDLWWKIFSINRAQFESLALQSQAQPARERRYWLARDSDLKGGRWTQSLGSPDRLVALYFPRATGCPRFAAGVRLYGVVFIDADCPDPIAGNSVELFGSLIVNGKLNLRNASLQLNHVQVADSRQTGLRFPVLRSLWVPGTWRDF